MTIQSHKKNNFNSIKGTIKTQRGKVEKIVIIHFNSIKGTIKTRQALT